MWPRLVRSYSRLMCVSTRPSEALTLFLNVAQTCQYTDNPSTKQNITVANTGKGADEGGKKLR